jgi:hypothetical protein
LKVLSVKVCAAECLEAGRGVKMGGVAWLWVDHGFWLGLRGGYISCNVGEGLEIGVA